MVTNFALPWIQQMGAYHPPLDGRTSFDGLLLDFNERSSPAPGTEAAIKEFLRAGASNRYPEYFDLTTQIGSYCEVDSKNVLITNGADQGIELAFRTFTTHGDVVVIPSPSFAMYNQAASAVGAEVDEVVYGQEMNFPEEKYLATISRTKPKLVVICNPNSPTGTLASREQVESIVAGAPNSIVLVDETYFEYSQTTVADLLETYTNLLIVRSFSKSFGLAALRAGFMLASETHVTEIAKVRGPYDVNQLAQLAMSISLEDLEEMNKYRDEVMAEAKPFVENFFRENNISFFSSAANFILFQPDEPERVLQILESNGVRLRNQNKKHIEGSLRVTIGTLSEMKQFVSVYSSQVLK